MGSMDDCVLHQCFQSRLNSFDFVRQVCVRIGREDTVHRSMLTLFSALLTDPEREVKTVACSDLSKLCDFVGAEAFTPALLVQLKSLLEDESPNVRSTLVRRA